MKAVITGISGQDGQLMAQALVAKGYQVVGLTGRRDATTQWTANLREGSLEILSFDYDCERAIWSVIQNHHPELFFNFAAMSTGLGFFSNPLQIYRRNASFVAEILEGIRLHSPNTRFFQASSSEIFGNVTETPQDENTPLRPISPYGAAKAYAHMLVALYRDAFGIHCSAGILYNHESHLRRLDYVLPKICYHAAAIKAGICSKLELGALDTARDWGSAKEYVEAMIMMVENEQATDYVLATGKLTTVREACDYAFDFVGLNASDYIMVNPNFIRPIESKQLLGDPSKATKRLGWTAAKTVRTVVEEMVEYHARRIALSGSSINAPAT